jgi:hypothetical protein
VVPKGLRCLTVALAAWLGTVTIPVSVARAVPITVSISRTVPIPVSIPETARIGFTVAVLAEVARHEQQQQGRRGRPQDSAAAWHRRTDDSIHDQVANSMGRTQERRTCHALLTVLFHHGCVHFGSTGISSSRRTSGAGLPPSSMAIYPPLSTANALFRQDWELCAHCAQLFASQGEMAESVAEVQIVEKCS